MPTFNAAQTARVGTMIEMTGDILTQLIIHSNQKTMSSLEIAELVESNHADVRRSIERLAAKVDGKGKEKTPVITLPPLAEVSNTGFGPRTISVYHLCKRDSLIVVAQLYPEFTARIVDRWQELEAQAETGFKVPTTLSAALRLAADQADTIEAQQAKLAITTPKAEALDRITLSDGSMCLTNAAKVLGMPPKKFIDWMQQHEWIYRRAGSSKHIGYQSRVQAGYLDHKVTTVSRTDGTEKTVEQVLVTTKGLAKLAQVVGAGKQVGLFGGEAA